MPGIAANHFNATTSGQGQGGLRADPGAQALSLLCEAPALTSLSLYLGATHIGSQGAEVLVLLAEASKLRCLTLSLGATEVGPDGVVALSFLGLSHPGPGCRTPCPAHGSPVRCWLNRGYGKKKAGKTVVQNRKH